MATKITGYAPFAYDFETDGEFVSFMKQRNAKYKTPAEEDFNTEDISGLDLFRNNIQAPTPQIKEIDGYDAASEIQNTNNETTETETPTVKPTDDNNTGDNENNTDNPTDNLTDNPTVDNGEGGTETPTDNPTDNPTVVDNGENNTDNPTVNNDTETQG